MSATSTKYDLLCAGLIVADHVCAPIPQIPPSGGLITTEKLELATGGCASNVAVDATRLGLRAAIVGRIGGDPLGEYVRKALEGEGVDCGLIVESETAQTAATLVVNVVGEDRRFIHAVGANAEFTGEEITREMLAASRAIYVGGYGLNPALGAGNVLRLFSQARELGVMTVLDIVIAEPELARGYVEPVLGVTDFFLPNTTEAGFATGLEDPLQQAERFLSWGAKHVIVTCGGEGCVMLGAGVRVKMGVHAVPVVDGTGTGDAFVSGFLYGRLKGARIEDCLRYGTAMGASCVRSTGSTTGVFRRDELEEFVRRNRLAATPV